jgi:hypothetical protein
MPALRGGAIPRTIRARGGTGGRTAAAVRLRAPRAPRTDLARGLARPGGAGWGERSAWSFLYEGAGTGSAAAWMGAGRVSERRSAPVTSAPAAKMAAAHQKAVV